MIVIASRMASDQVTLVFTLAVTFSLLLSIRSNRQTRSSLAVGSESQNKLGQSGLREGFQESRLATCTPPGSAKAEVWHTKMVNQPRLSQRRADLPSARWSGDTASKFPPGCPMKSDEALHVAVKTPIMRLSAPVRQNQALLLASTLKKIAGSHRHRVNLKKCT
jgi:hypothetical protein